MRIGSSNIPSLPSRYGVSGPKASSKDVPSPEFKQQLNQQSVANVVEPDLSATVELAAKMTGEDYLKLQKESAAAYTPEMKSAEEHQALISSADKGAFEDVSSNTEPAVSEKTETSVIPPMPDFSGMSDSQKLATLRKLHEATDYSGMTDVEKYKLMNDRFEAAFPNMNALLSGVYGPTATNCAEFDPNYRPALPERISEERHYQWMDLGLKSNGRINPLHKEAYYSGMSDKEIMSAIVNKYSGKTLNDSVSILRELSTVGLDNGVACQALDRIRISLLSQVRGVPVSGSMFANPQNSLEYSKLSALASGTRMGWGEIGSMVLSSSYEYAITCSDPELALKEHEEFQEKWNELLDLLMQVGA